MHSCSDQNENELKTMKNANKQLPINKNESRHLNPESTASLQENISKIHSTTANINKLSSKIMSTSSGQTNITRAFSMNYDPNSEEESQELSLPTFPTKLSSTTSIGGKPRRRRLTKRRAMPPRSNSVPWKTETEQKMESDQNSLCYTASSDSFVISVNESGSSKKFTYASKTNSSSYGFLHSQTSAFSPTEIAERNVKSAMASRILHFSHYKSNSLPSNESDTYSSVNIADNVKLTKTVSNETISLKDKSTEKKSKVLVIPQMDSDRMAEASLKVDRTSGELSHLLSIIIVEDDSDLAGGLR